MEIGEGIRKVRKEPAILWRSCPSRYPYHRIRNAGIVQAQEKQIFK